MMNVIVISTFFFTIIISEAVADEFVRGAQEAGNEVEKVTLRGKDIRFCKGCLALASASFTMLSGRPILRASSKVRYQSHQTMSAL